MKTVFIKIFSIVALVFTISLMIISTIDLVKECDAYNRDMQTIEAARKEKKPPVIIEEDENGEELENFSLDRNPAATAE